VNAKRSTAKNRKWLFAIAVLACSCTPPLDKIKSELASNPTSGHYLQVPFISQQELYCGPASLAMVANYYGVKVSQDEIAARYFQAEAGGLFTVDMIAAAKELGFKPEHGPGNWEQITNRLRNGNPVIVFFSLTVEPFPTRHFAVAIGYLDSANRQYLILHSGSKPDQVIPRPKFERMWSQEDSWMMTFY